MIAIKQVKAVYFSPTGTTRKVVTGIAREVARTLRVPMEERDFTLPRGRTAPLAFRADDLVLMGTPVYAGRVPNVLLEYLGTLEGEGTPCVPVVTFGNRDYDDALVELRDIAARGNLLPVAAAAFVGEHSFSRVLAKDRPDAKDLEVAVAFAREIAGKCRAFGEGKAVAPVEVPGNPFPYRGYYTPRDREGMPVDIRKVKPLTSETCNDCGLCAKVCPMGSIDPGNARVFTGICIKCGACIKKCPKQAKYYDDAGYLYHRHELEEMYTRRAEICLFP